MTLVIWVSPKWSHRVLAGRRQEVTVRGDARVKQRSGTEGLEDAGLLRREEGPGAQRPLGAGKGGTPARPPGPALPTPSPHDADFRL